MEGYIKKQNRKTILFLADDMRLPSGIGVMTKELIIGNAHRYNFVHVAGAIQHPEAGKILDVSAEVNMEVGIDDSSILLYPYNGYGDPDLVRMILDKHNIDAIVHFTDPRYWVWLYRMSAEIRQRVPIFYYHIWDDLPAPHYNRPFYESCDLLMGISRQSDNIARLVLGNGNYLNINKPFTPSAEEIGRPVPKTCFVPHGINTKYFYPIDRSNKELQEYRKKVFNGTNPKFVLFYNNRNIRRKMTSDAIFAFKKFYDSLSESDRPHVRFVLHTQSRDENGTDLPAVIDAVCPDIADKILITDARINAQDLNLLYNSCDVVINVGSNEGWGLSSTEALLTGRVLINNVTGGLQDQCRFEDENGNWIEFNDDFGSNHGGRYRKHGKWVKPVFPASISIQGSIPTPYIFDDRCSIDDIADAIKYWYAMPEKDRIACGKAGYEWATSEEAGFTAEIMANSFYKNTSMVIDAWKPVPTFSLYNVKNQINKFKNKKSGISI